MCNQTFVIVLFERNVFVFHDNFIGKVICGINFPKFMIPFRAFSVSVSSEFLPSELSSSFVVLVVRYPPDYVPDPISLTC